MAGTVLFFAQYDGPFSNFSTHEVCYNVLIYVWDVLERTYKNVHE